MVIDQGHLLRRKKFRKIVLRHLSRDKNPLDICRLEIDILKKRYRDETLTKMKNCKKLKSKYSQLFYVK